MFRVGNGRIHRNPCAVVVRDPPEKSTTATATTTRDQKSKKRKRRQFPEAPVIIMPQEEEEDRYSFGSQACPQQRLFPMMMTMEAVALLFQQQQETFVFQSTFSRQRRKEQQQQQQSNRGSGCVGRGKHYSRGNEKRLGKARRVDSGQFQQPPQWRRRMKRKEASWRLFRLWFLWTTVLLLGSHFGTWVPVVMVVQAKDNNNDNNSKNYYNYNFNNNNNNNNNNKNNLNNNDMGMDQADFESATTSSYFTSTINPRAFLNVQWVCGSGTNRHSSYNNANAASTTTAQQQQQQSNQGTDVMTRYGAAGEDYSKKTWLETAGMEILITSVYLTCDSPGAYYQGSQTYRNSNVCTAGDQAQVNIALTIHENSDNTSEQNYANELIYVCMESGFYNRYTTLFSKKKLCQMDISSETTGSGTVCPTPGKYYMQVFYDVPSYLAGTSSKSSYNNNNNDNNNKDGSSSSLAREDSQMHYTPDVRFIFTNAQGTVVGCASTGAAALNKERAQKSMTGIGVLTVAVCSFLLLFAWLLWMNHKRRKRLERLMERKQKAHTYQYFKTLPNGQVVPLPPPPSTTTTANRNQYPSYNSHHHPYPHPHPTMDPRRPPPPDVQQPQEAQAQQEQYYSNHHNHHPHSHNPNHHHHHLMPATSLDSMSGMDSQSGVAGGGYPTPPLSSSYGPSYGPHAAAAASSSNHPHPIPMISNPSYNETHLPTRPVI